MINKKHPHPDRRQEICDRIMNRVDIRDCGYRVNGIVSPCKRCLKAIRDVIDGEIK